MKEHGFLYVSYYDYGFRQMDPQLGRWHVIDAMAESYMNHSPYAYTMNDPVNYTDLLGLKAMSQLANDDPLAMAASGRIEFIEGAGWQWFSNHTMGISNNAGSSGISREAGPSIKDVEDYEKAKKNGETSETFESWYSARRRAAWKLGYTSVQGALDAGVKFSAVKWKRTNDLSSINIFRAKEKDKTVNEVIMIETAYVDVYLAGVFEGEYKLGDPDRNNFWGAGGDRSSLGGGINEGELALLADGLNSGASLLKVGTKFTGPFANLTDAYNIYVQYDQYQNNQISYNRALYNSTGSASSIIVGTVVGAECGGPYGALAGFGTSLLFNAGEQGYNTMAPIYRDNVSKWNTAVNNPGEIQSRFTGVPMQFINGFGF
jgi:RHS repeat-associated protein